MKQDKMKPDQFTKLVEAHKHGVTITMMLETLESDGVIYDEAFLKDFAMFLRTNQR